MVSQPKISIKNLNISFGKHQVIKSLSMEVFSNEILGIIGPANSGKTTFLRAINRLLDLQPHVRIKGEILIDNVDIYSQSIDLQVLRRKVGMILPLPVALPMSIFENVAYGLRRSGINNKAILKEKVEKGIKSAYLWDEVKNELNRPAMTLSGGQQQRLCIARTLVLEPEIILFDEPCSGLDPISTAAVEETMSELKKKSTIILVTNNTKQAARVSTRTAFFLIGEMIEIGNTTKIFTTPEDQRTNDYIAGVWG